MVDEVLRGLDLGFSDALKGDPNVDAAAIAALVGAEPLTFLGSAGADLAIRSAVYERAYEIDQERRVAELKVLVNVVAGRSIF